jgi:hypothetical protein
MSALYNGSLTSATTQPIAVILPAISSNLQNSTTLEPQLVQTRSPNYGTVYLDSTKCTNIQGGTYYLSTAQTYDQILNPLISNARRVAFKRITMTYDLPNIFSGNSILIFKVYKTGDPSGGYTITVDLTTSNQIYPYSTSLYASLLQEQMNAGIAAQAPPGYPTVTVTPDTNPNIDYVIIQLGDGVNKWIAIDPTCNFITGHINTITLTDNDYTTITNSTTPALIIYNFPYDPYIDIHSTALTQNSKLKSSTNSYNSNNIVHRINNLRFGTFGYTEIHLNWINITLDTEINTIDLTFVDQYGQIMSRIDPKFFRWTIEIIVEK